jgi:nitroreductase
MQRRLVHRSSTLLDKQPGPPLPAALESVALLREEDSRPMCDRLPFEVMDTFLAITSKRDTRRYADRPIPEKIEGRILDAGRLAGSARNRQPWRFLVVESADRREHIAEAVYAAENVRGAQLVVAIVGSSGLDGGRCVQNMMLAAWNDGVASCPNGIADADKARAALGLGDDDAIAVVLTFGFPAQDRSPVRHSPSDWSARADRTPLDELVERL